MPDNDFGQPPPPVYYRAPPPPPPVQGRGTSNSIKITRDSAVTLPVMVQVGVIAFMLTLAWTVFEARQQILDQVHSHERRLSKVEAGSGRRWTVDHMALWCSHEQNINRGWNCYDPYAVQKRLPIGMPGWSIREPGITVTEPTN
ncbi:MAG: hypothetical protein AAFY06_00180 [Pseudomonadota bacterium]